MTFSWIFRGSSRFGRIDILVNDVGGSRNAKIWEMKVEDWDFVLRLNLRPTFLCTRAAVPHMMRQRSGRIICMSSGAREGIAVDRILRRRLGTPRPRPESGRAYNRGTREIVRRREGGGRVRSSEEAG